VHTLKIDRGFVTSIAGSPDDQAIVRSIIDLADAFGLDTMAEGVETPEAVATLVASGCHQAQGYLISKPLPARDLEPLLRRGHIPRSQLTQPSHLPSVTRSSG
jgi:EAL domain-containing protein (putative c-di-GMP-specific phosphodiesterase class I)